MKKDKFEYFKSKTKDLQNLEADSFYNKSKMLSNMIIDLKKDFNFNKIKLNKLNKKQRKELGFATWSKKTGKYTLIPLWIFNLLKDEEFLICPLFDNEKPTQKINCDDDARGGCVAYQFYKEIKG